MKLRSKPVRTASRIAVMAALSAALSVEADAAPLPVETCSGLRQEHGLLAAQGAAQDLARTPDEVTASGGKPRLELLRRFLELEQQLRFRCPLRITAEDLGQPTEDGIPAPMRKPTGQTTGSLDLRPAIGPEDVAHTVGVGPAVTSVVGDGRSREKQRL